MHKEGHRRKTFKKRYFVVWPRDFSDCGMDAPVLFYFEDDQPERRPKGTVSLANLKCRLPKKTRTIKIPGEKDIGEFCFRVDIDGAPEGHNKFIFATESQQEMIRTRPTHPKLFVDGATASRALCVRGCRNFVSYPFFTHFPPFFAHFLRLDARNPENTARSPGENGKKSIKIG